MIFCARWRTCALLRQLHQSSNHAYLRTDFNENRYVGLICEYKTRSYDNGSKFTPYGALAQFCARCAQVQNLAYLSTDFDEIRYVGFGCDDKTHAYCKSSKLMPYGAMAQVCASCAQVLNLAYLFTDYDENRYRTLVATTRRMIWQELEIDAIWRSGELAQFCAKCAQILNLAYL